MGGETWRFTDASGAEEAVTRQSAAQRQQRRGAVRRRSKPAKGSRFSPTSLLGRPFGTGGLSRPRRLEQPAFGAQPCDAGRRPAPDPDPRSPGFSHPSLRGGIGAMDSHVDAGAAGSSARCVSLESERNFLLGHVFCHGPLSAKGGGREREGGGGGGGGEGGVFKGMGERRERDSSEGQGELVLGGRTEEKPC